MSSEKEQSSNIVKKIKDEDFLVKKIIDYLYNCDTDDFAGVFDYIYGSKTEADTSGDETKYTISYDESLFSKDFFDGD